MEPQKTLNSQSDLKVGGIRLPGFKAMIIKKIRSGMKTVGQNTREAQTVSYSAAKASRRYNGERSLS